MYKTLSGAIVVLGIAGAAFAAARPAAAAKNERSFIR